MKNPSVETFIVDGVVVDYKLQRAKDDRKSLLIMFSGFRSPGTYDFDGAPSRSLRGNILWIQDQFQGDFSYYMCRNMDFAIGDAVQALIEYVRGDLGLEKDNCILAGFSKGGSAAVYHGIKYDYGVIVASVPQFQIATYMGQHWPMALKAMVGQQGDLGRRKLDDLLPSMIAEDAKRDRHIYLVSAAADELHEVQVGPFINLMRRYSNFNYVLTDSSLVQDHVAVTQYNVPFLTGLFALLMEGIQPRIGEVRNGSDSYPRVKADPLHAVRSRREVVSQLTSCRLEGGRFYPSGYAFVKGFAASAYGCVRTRLVLTSKEESLEFALGGVFERSLSTRFYENEFCDYSYGGFASLRREGIDLENLPIGTYRAELIVEHEEAHERVPCSSGAPVVAWGMAGNRLVKYESTGTGAVLVIRPLVGTAPDKALWKLMDWWANGTILHIEGHFAVKGIEAASYEEVDYYLLLHPVDKNGSDTSFKLAVGNKLGARRSAYFDDPWIDYSKAYYATPRYKGIDIADLHDGSYVLSVTARFGNALYTMPLDGTLVIKESTIASLRLHR